VVATQPLGLFVEVVQYLVRWQVQPREGLDRGAQLTHPGRGGQGVTHHVPYYQGHPVAGQWYRVVPVAPHVHALFGWEVPVREPYPGGGGEQGRQDGAL
jgi:hypothetical protein